MKVGILGATGPAGRAISARLAAAGLHVTLGSRSVERSEEACDALRRRWPGRLGDLVSGTNDDAASAEVVVVATPAEAAAATAGALCDHLAGKVVISMANALARVDGEFRAVVVPEGSVAQAVAAAAPEAEVVGAFHHLPAKALADLDTPMAGDVVVCADSDRAYQVTAELVGHIPDLRSLHAGSLAQSGPVESFTAVLLGLNHRYRALATLAVPGIVEQTGPAGR